MKNEHQQTNDQKEIIYDERHRFWTEQALNQFGFASNFFYVISVGFFVYLIEIDTTSTLLKLDLDLSFSLSKLLFGVAITLIFISVVFGSLTVLSRLHDLRLTRHKTYIRKRYFKIEKQTLDDNHLNIDEYNFYNKVKNLYTTCTSRNYFITDNDFEDTTKLTNKFIELRLINLLLARFSWTTFSLQIITLLISIFAFFISIITKNAY